MLLTASIYIAIINSVGISLTLKEIIDFFGAVMPFVTMQYTQGPTGVFGGMKSTDMLAMGNYFQELFAGSIPADTKGTPFKFNEVDFLPQALPVGAIFDSPVNFVVETFGYDWRVEIMTQKDAMNIVKKYILAYLQQERKIKLDPNKPLIWLKYVDPRGVHV